MRVLPSSRRMVVSGSLGSVLLLGALMLGCLPLGPTGLSASETSLVEAASGARVEAERQLAVARQGILDQRAALTARVQQAQSRLAEVRGQIESATAARIQAEETARDRRRDVEHDRQLTRSDWERLAAVAQLDAALRGIDTSPTGAEAQPHSERIEAGVHARLQRWRGALASTFADEEVLTRAGRNVRTRVLRLGAAAALACGPDADSAGFLVHLENGRWMVSGPRPADDWPRVGRMMSVPLDADGSLARQNEEPHGSVSAWFRSGGFFMWPILLVGVSGAAIVFERWWWLRRTRPRLPLDEREASSPVVVTTPTTPVARVLEVGLATRSLSRPAREAALEQALLAEEPALERGLSLLGVLAAAAPLLGLLGTVTGMIGMFQTIAGHGTGNLRLLSGSISVALVTTQFGLLVAVPLLLAHAWLGRAVERRQGMLEETASGCLQLGDAEGAAP